LCITKNNLNLSDYKDLIRLAKFMGINHPETLSHKSLVKAIWYILKRPPLKDKLCEERELLELIADSFKAK